MLVTCGEVCYKLTTGGAEEVPELLSTQEEADIHLLLHAAQAAAEGQLKYFEDYSERQEGHVCRARVLLGN